MLVVGGRDSARPPARAGTRQCSRGRSLPMRSSSSGEFEPAPFQSSRDSSGGRRAARARAAGGSPAVARPVRLVPAQRLAGRRRRAVAGSPASAARSTWRLRTPCPARRGSAPACCPGRRSRAREPDGDDRRGDERHHDRGVLPDQASMRSSGGFHVPRSGPETRPVDSSARMIMSCGTLIPSRAAVFRLTANSIFGKSSTGRSAGEVPFRMLST